MMQPQDQLPDLRHPLPKFNLKFYEAWRAKGVFDERRQWSAWKPMDDKPVVTIWHTDLSGGPSEVIDDCDEHRALYLFKTERGDWVKKPKGKEYLAMVAECIVHEKPAEVILLAGMRHDGEASEFYAASIDDNFYYVMFTSVDADGVIEGYFLTKDQLK